MACRTNIRRHPIINEDLRNIVNRLQKSIYQLEGKAIVIIGSTGLLATYLT